MSATTLPRDAAGMGRLLEDVASGEVVLDVEDVNPASPLEGADKVCQMTWGRMLLGQVVGTEPCEASAVARVITTCKADHHATRLVCDEHRVDMVSSDVLVCAGPDGECGRLLTIVEFEEL